MQGLHVPGERKSGHHLLDHRCLGARQAGHDHRGPRQRRHAAPGAAGVARPRRRAVRLLPARSDHGRGR
ncbi:MAG TPA: hypothetical protein VEQ87_06990, partial [Burkholderiales bacterium]|nr:hypothetical protein [Burkholderiales bacterium]